MGKCRVEYLSLFGVKCLHSFNPVGIGIGGSSKSGKLMLQMVLEVEQVQFVRRVQCVGHGRDVKQV